MKLGLKGILLMLIGAQLSALCLFVALKEALEAAGSPVRPPRQRDPRISVGWQGRA